MKKLYKKILVTVLLIIALLISCVQVYASTVLDTNLLTMIKIILDANMPTFEEKIYDDTRDLVENNLSVMERNIDTSTEKVINNVNQYIDEEAQRAEEEVNEYMYELIEQMNLVMSEEEERLKEFVTLRMDDTISVLKQELNAYFYLELEEHLMEQLVP